MHSITPYADTTHRPQVIALWKTAFGYDAPHNAPGLVIDKKLDVQDDLFFVEAGSAPASRWAQATVPSARREGGPAGAARGRVFR